MSNVLDISQLQKLTDFVNNEFEILKQLEHIPLGPDYATLSKEDAQNHLTIHRIASKFQVPSSQNSSERKCRTLENVYNYDSKGITDFQPAKMEMSPHVRKALYEVRSFCDTVLCDFRYNVGSASITTGETFVSNRGDTSLLAKLRDKSQWCVTPECFDLFASVAYRNYFLKKNS